MFMDRGESRSARRGQAGTGGDRPVFFLQADVAPGHGAPMNRVAFSGLPTCLDGAHMLEVDNLLGRHTP